MKTANSAKAIFAGNLRGLAAEAAVLIKQMYEFIKSKNEEDAEGFLSYFKHLLNEDSKLLYEIDAVYEEE